MNIIKTSLSILLTLIISALLLVFSALLIISTFFKEESMQQNIKQIDVIHEMNKIQNSSSAGSKAEISDIITMAYEEANNHGIDSKLVDTIFNDDETKVFLGKMIGTSTDYLINGNKNKILTSEEFNQLLDNNIDRWIKESGAELSESKKQVLLIRIKSLSRGLIDTMPNYNTLEDKIGTSKIELINKLFSKEIRAILAVLIALLTVLIIGLKKEKMKYLFYIGTSFIICGITFLITSFVIEDILAFVLTDYNVSFIISTFSNMLSRETLIISIIFIIISLALYIIYGKKNWKLN